MIIVFSHEIGNGRLCCRFQTVDFGRSNYEIVMFLTQTYYLTTAERVKLELDNNEHPTITWCPL